MPRDSNGTYTRAVTPPANGDVASATDFNTEMDDIATAFTGSLTANGSKAWGADQNANGYRLVGLGTPASSGHAATKGYVDGAFQPVDATLTAWAALVGSANQIAYWTGTDTFALTGFTAFGRSLVDDADDAAGRTTLGLGTSATVNTGTSGATIPLLNGANTWSGAQTITTLLTLQNGSDRAIDVRDSGGTVRGFVGVAGIDGAAPTNALRLRGEGGVFLSFNGGGGFSLTSASAATLGGSTVWHAGNDGAGSTMDADLLDGLQATAFGRLGVANTWTAAQTFNVNPEIPVGIYARFGLTGTNDWYLGKPNTTDLYLYRDAGVAWIISGSGLEIALGTLLAPIRIGSETSGTLTSASRNTQVHCSGNITLPASGMTDGDIILIDPRGTARTITRPSAHTMYVNDSDVATATTPAHNLVSAKFCGGSKWVLQGAV
jgi:hypothetical protein